MSASKCPMGQSLGVSHGTSPPAGRLGQTGHRGHLHGPTSRAPIIPSGSWPRRMAAELAAAYCGERSVDAFLRRVGKEYPNPRIAEGRRRLWLRDDLDAAILPAELSALVDVAGDL